VKAAKADGLHDVLTQHQVLYVRVGHHNCLFAGTTEHLAQIVKTFDVAIDAAYWLSTIVVECDTQFAPQ